MKNNAKTISAIGNRRRRGTQGFPAWYKTELYHQVNADTLPQSVVEKIAFLKLTPVNKLVPTQFGRRISDWHMSVYLTKEEWNQIDNTRKESKGQGSKATKEI